MNRLAIFFVLIIFQVLVACHGDDEDTTDDPLVRDWLVEKVSLDNVDVTDYYSRLKLVITSAGSYRVANPVPPVWQPDGTYTFSNNQFQREDGVVMDVTELSETKLVLQFQYDAVALDGRTDHVSGMYTFEFLAN